nr:MAG TPA: hypothetical protein [Bacteriophage sp.]
MKLTGFESSKINSDMVNHPSHYNLPDNSKGANRDEINRI